MEFYSGLIESIKDDLFKYFSQMKQEMQIENQFLQLNFEQVLEKKLEEQKI